MCRNPNRRFRTNLRSVLKGVAWRPSARTRKITRWREVFDDGSKSEIPNPEAKSHIHMGAALH